jgi:hypothetical protein
MPRPGYTDYRFKFPVANYAAVTAQMPAFRNWLRNALAYVGTENMLGDGFNAQGQQVDDPADAVIFGRRGVAGGQGDPAFVYFHFRAVAPPGGLPFNPATYGIVATTPAESAAVLGVWL